MEKNEELEVFEGEIVDETKRISPVRSGNGIEIEKKEKRMEKMGNWIDVISLIGGGIVKLFSSFSKSTSADTFSDRSKNDPSSGRRQRRRGRRS